MGDPLGNERVSFLTITAAIAGLENFLRMLNADIVRAMFLTGAVVALALLVYTPNLRRQIRDQFRLGQHLSALGFAPFSSSGWTLASGSEEPTVSQAANLAQILAVSAAMSHAVDPLPKARFVRFRGSIQRFWYNPAFLWGSSSGVSFSVLLKMRRKSSGDAFDVRVFLGDSKTARRQPTDMWDCAISPYVDVERQTVITVDLKPIIKHYGRRKVEYLGVAEISMIVASATLDRILVCESASLGERFKTFWKMSTWIPWRAA